MELLRRAREPVLIVLLGAVAVRILVGVVGAALYGARTVDPLLLFLTVVVAVSCLLPPPSAHARTLGVVTAAVLGVAMAVGLGFGLFGLGWDASVRGVLLLEVLLALLPTGLGVAVLIGLLRAAPAPTAVRAPEQVPSAGPAPALPPAPATAAPPPVWPTDAATGLAWTTAGEAAAGAPAREWTDPTPGAGWQPIPGPPPPTAQPDDPGWPRPS